MRTLISILIAAAACSSDRSTPTPAPSSTTASQPALAGATQDDLARELDAAERRGTWTEVKRRWEGQRLRWSVTRHRVLCRSADACNVAAFPIGRAAEPGRQGWMPALELSAAQLAALEAHCGGEESCRVTIEGTLSKLDVSAEQPTNLRFSDVQLVDSVASGQDTEGQGYRSSADSIASSHDRPARN